VLAGIGLIGPGLAAESQLDDADADTADPE
jgi:hypothetical protein